MWRRVRDLAGCTSLAWLALAACGKLEESQGDDSGGATAARAGFAEGGAGAGSGAGSASGGGSGTAGAAMSLAGKPGASGGAVGRGGGAPSGGAEDTRGGGPSTAEAGSSTAGGEGGAPSCDGHYLSCGCGCCAGPTPAQRCAYPGFGPTIDELVGDDLARRNDTAGCAAAGCSLGVDYFCCQPPSPQAEVVSYQTSVSFGGYDRLRLHKTGAVDCSTVTLVSPTLEHPEFPVELPSNWAIDQITRVPCIASAIGPRAIGAIGKFSLRVLADACVIDAHLTAFFVNAHGGVDAERFDAEGAAVDLALARCK